MTENRVQSQSQSQSQSQIEIRVIESHYHLAETEKNPTIHIFLSDGTCLRQERDNNTWVFQCPEEMEPDTMIGIDCYTEQLNENHISCKHRTGFDNMYLKTVLGRTVNCRLKHSFDSHLSKASITLEVRGTSPTFKPVSALSYTPEQQQTCQRRLQRLINRYHIPFQTMTPSKSAFRHIHAPVFKTRLCYLPGISYWMSEWVGFNEDYLEHMTQLVLARHNVSVEDFTSGQHAQTDDHTHTPTHNEYAHLRRANHILCDVCTIYPTSCPYISDYISKGSTLNPCESFDDLFLRNAGDCEDFSRAICLIFNHIRFSQWKNPLGRTLQELSKAYIAFGILGSVTRPSYRGGLVGNKKESNMGVAAHMYVQLIPIHLFNRMCPTYAQPIEQEWMLHSSLLVAEGTGHVGCDLLQSETRTLTEAQTPVVHRAWSRICSQGSQGAHFERTSYPTLHNPFYRSNIHAYTSYFFQQQRQQPRKRTLKFNQGHQKHLNVGHFTFCNSNTNHHNPHIKCTYGVPFEHLFSKPESITMYPHTGLTPDDVCLIRYLLSKECPTPALHISDTGNEKTRTNQVNISQNQNKYIDMFSHHKTPALCQTADSFGSEVGATRITWVCEQMTESHLLWRCRVIL